MSGLGDLFKKDDFDFDKLDEGECIEATISGTEGGKKESALMFLACRTDENTIKIKGDMMDDEIQMEMVLKKRPMKKKDF